MAPRPAHLALDRQICFSLYAASRAMTRLYGPLLQELDLTYPQYVTMLALWDAATEDAGALTVGALGERLHLDSGTLTPLLRRLEQAGLVTRRRDPADERRVLVDLTEPGRVLQAQAARIPEAVAGCAGLTVDVIDGLRAQVDRLTTVVEQALSERAA